MYMYKLPSLESLLPLINGRISLFQTGPISRYATSRVLASEDVCCAYLKRRVD